MKFHSETLSHIGGIEKPWRISKAINRALGIHSSLYLWLEYSPPSFSPFGRTPYSSSLVIFLPLLRSLGVIPLEARRLWCLLPRDREE